MFFYNLWLLLADPFRVGKMGDRYSRMSARTSALPPDDKVWVRHIYRYLQRIEGLSKMVPLICLGLAIATWYAYPIWHVATTHRKADLGPTLLFGFAVFIGCYLLGRLLTWHRVHGLARQVRGMLHSDPSLKRAVNFILMEDPEMYRFVKRYILRSPQI